MKSGKKILVGGLLIALSACGGGGGGSGSSGGSRQGGLDSANFDCDGACANQRLTEADVVRIIQQGIAGAELLGSAATFAVSDRVGNVLAVYQMNGAPGTTQINGGIGAQGGLEGVTVPAAAAAISKAGTGAYLSSQGNAFSSRTASQIVQQNFDPGERNQPGGPLFGVQFSQLICSDVTTLNPAFLGGIPSGSKAVFGGLAGPRPLPLGLSADPGGIPLYKNGDVVGGIGVEFDGLYTADPDIRDFDDDPEERVALHASRGFEAPSERTANVMIVAGRSLRYTDISYDQLEALPANLPPFDPSRLVAVPLFTNGQVRQGSQFGSAESGVAFTSRAGISSMTLVNGGGGTRFPTRGGSPFGGFELTPTEVDAILDSALLTTNRARAAIRRPLDTPARVSIWVIDHLGIPLGFTRSADAPVFGIDVSLQKARAAAFFSSADAAERIEAARNRNAVGGFNDYITPARALLGGDAFTGRFAFSNRAVGNLSRPFFPDGINGNPPGPFSLPFPGSAPGRSWSPFNDGIQLDLVFQRLVQPLGVPVNPPPSIPDTCTDPGVFGRRLGNGTQIFPGSVPLYRGETLIGAIGISGDGIDQDDMTAFFGASRQGLDFAGHSDVGDPVLGFNAPTRLRADRIEVNSNNVRLRYVNCPEGPFSGSNDQNVCDGL